VPVAVLTTRQPERMTFSSLMLGSEEQTVATWRISVCIFERTTFEP